MTQMIKDYLIHYGVARRSGRYPWGSGKDPQRNRDFLSRVHELRKSGFIYTDENGKTYKGDTAIAKSMGLSTSEFRTGVAICTNERRALDVARAKSLQDDGLGATEIGRQMGLPESTVRSLLNEKSEAKMNQAKNTAAFLKKEVDEKEMIDVGAGVERELKISKERLNQALTMLKSEGYNVYEGGIPQVTNPGHQINQKVLCKPGIEHKEIYEYDRIKTITEYTSHDNGETFSKFVYPKSMDSKRLMVRYDEDGGTLKDGIVEIRRGVDDLSLGDSRYSQVRILVDNTHYIKGMAVYSDDMPPGVDIVFNTNKKRGTPALGDKNNTVLKTIKDDPDNPFGSLIMPKGQSTYIDKNGKEQLSLINKRADEGDWTDWQDTLPSQFLGKQSLSMATKQLNLAKADRMAEFDDIKSLTNPTIKRHLLEKFADNCDAAAVHLKAAALPGQKYHVIIPVNTLKDNEVYAPQYTNGTKLALIRYPHGGTFEIPVLTVNNKHAAAKKIIGPDSIDAIGITKKNADRLSGADFDGDTVMCIPTDDPGGKVKVSRKPALTALEGFDPKLEYGADHIEKDANGVEHAYRNGREFKIMKNTGTQMGVVSNLITDMTLAGAKNEELARAVKHSMVVIDAEKHKLDYKQSEIDNDIVSLKKKYQPKYDEDGNYVGYGGASTLLSRSKGETTIEKRQGQAKVNQKGKEWYDPTKPEGAKIYKTADDLYYPVMKKDKTTGITTIRTADGKKITYRTDDKEAQAKYYPVKRTDPKTGEVYFTDKTGKIKYKRDYKKQESTRMAETDDANTLMSAFKHPMEKKYADYANSMKNLGNQARMEMINTGTLKYNRQAKETYKAEVSSLMNKLNDALMNTTRERAAQRSANADVAAKKAANPELKNEDLKKAGQQALNTYRNKYGAIARRDRNIEITDREWEAIQAGAISDSKLKDILNNTDIDKLRERATPRTTNTVSSAKASRIKAMSASNYSLEEIAKATGCSPATVSKLLKGAN